MVGSNNPDPPDARSLTPTTVLRTVGIASVYLTLLFATPFVSKISPLLAATFGWSWMMAPGMLMSYVLIKRISWLERIPISFALGIGLAIPATVTAILLHLDLLQFLALSLTSSVLFILIIAILRDRLGQPESEKQGEPVIVVSGKVDGSTLALVVLLISLMMGLAWLAGNWPLAGDDLAGLPIFAETLRLGYITGFEPFHGTGTPVTPRNELIVLGYQGIMANKLSGLEPPAFFQNSRPFFIILAFLALYTLLHQSLKIRKQAVFMLCLWGIYLLATLKQDEPGSDMVTRIFQDKFLGWLIVVPIALVFMLWYLGNRQKRILIGFGVVALGAALLHPITLAQTMILCAGFGLVHLSIERSKSALWNVLIIGAILALCLIVPVIQYFRYIGRMPVDVAGLGDAIEYGQLTMAILRYRLWLLEGDRFIMHPSNLINPIVLLGFLFLPFPMIYRNKIALTQILFGGMILVPVLLYIPPIAALIGEFVTPYLIWRLNWPMFLFSMLILGWMVWLGIEKIATRFQHLSKGWAQFLHLCILVVPLGIVSLIAWPSIHYGLTNFQERAVQQGYTTCSIAQEALRYLDELSPHKPINVLGSTSLNLCIPGIATLANVVEYRGYGTVNRLPMEQIEASLQRIEDVRHFTTTEQVDDWMVETLRRYDIHYVVVERERISLELQMRYLPSLFSQAYSDENYSIYEVRKEIPSDSIIDGNSALREQQWQEAQKIFNQLVYENPSQVLAYIGLGLAHTGNGEIELALNAYKKANRLAPNEPAIHAYLGNTYLVMRDLEQAIQEYQTASSLAPELFVLRLSLGLNQQMVGLNDLARENIQKATELKSQKDTAAYYSLLGEIMASANWNSEALAAYQKALEIEPNAFRYINLAQQLSQSGDKNGAMQASLKAMQLDRWLGLPHIQLGRLYTETGQIEAAIKEFETARQLSPINNTVYILLGQALQEKEGVEAAIAYLEKLTHFNTYLPGPHRGLVPLYILNEEMEKAFQELEISEKLQPQDATIPATEGFLYLTLGEQENALAAYSQARRLNPNLLAVQLAQAILYAQNSDFNSEIGQIIQLVQSEPTAAWPHLLFARSLQRQGLWEEAQSEIELALKLYPFSASGYIELGNLLSARAEWESAAQAYQRALEIEPENLEALLGLGQIAQTADPSMVAAYAAWAGLDAEGSGYEEMALAIFNMALSTNPVSNLAFLNTANLFIQRGDYDQAEKIYRASLDTLGATAENYIALSELQKLRGDWEAAQQTLETALEKLPASAEPYPYLADLHLQRGEWEQAKAILENALVVDPAFFPSYTALSQILVYQGDYEEAQRILEQAVALNPDLAGVYSSLGLFYEEQGNLTAAESNLQKALDIQPLVTANYTNLAAFYHRHGQLQEALDLLQDGQIAAPPNTELFIELGNLYLDLQQKEEAIKWFQDAIAFKRNEAAPYLSLAALYQTSGEWEKALETLESAVKVLPADSNILLALGNLYQKLGRLQDARKQFESALSYDKSRPEPLIALALLESKLQTWDRAILSLQQAIENFPLHLNAYTTLGEIYRLMGKDQDALRSYHQGIENSLNQQEAMLARARYFTTQGEWESALKDYRDAWEVLPRSPKVGLELANFYLRRGDWKSSLGLLKELEKLPNGKASLYIGMGDIYIQQAQWKQAEQAYQQAIALEPNQAEGYLGLAQIFTLQGEEGNALEYLRKATLAEPQDTQALILLGEALRKQQNYKEAYSAFVQALELDPNNLSALTNLDELCVIMGLHEIDLTPWIENADLTQDANLYRTLGTVYQRRGEWKTAGNWFKRAVELDIFNSQNWLALGNYYRLLGEFDQAYEAYQQALELLPTNSDAWIGLGSILEKRELTDQAIEAYNQAVQIDPTKLEGYLSLAKIYNRLGENHQAIAALQTAISLIPTEMRGYSELGSIYVEIGESELALQTYQDGLTLLPGSAALHAKIADLSLDRLNAMFLKEQNQPTVGMRVLSDVQQAVFNEAIDWYQKALAIESTSEEALLGLGRLYALAGSIQDSLKYYQQSVAAHPRSILSLTYLANTYLTLQQPQDALQVFHRIQRLDPTNAALQGIVLAYTDLDSLSLSQAAEFVQFSQTKWLAIMEKIRQE